MKPAFQKLGIAAGLMGALLGLWAANAPSKERRQLEKAAMESAQYTGQYIRTRAGDYQKQFGALQSIKSTTCIRQFNAYQTFSDAWHKVNGRTMSTCYAYVQFERGDASIKLVMNRPGDGSAPWSVQKSEVQPGLTNCAASPQGDPGC